MLCVSSVVSRPFFMKCDSLNAEKKGKYLTSRFCFCVCVCVHPSGLPSPSTTCGRFNRFPTILWFLPSPADELIRLSGERKCCCIKFSWLSVTPWKSAQKSSEDSPELCAEFMHQVQQNCLSIWVAANCRDVQLQMQPEASHPNSRTHTHTQAHFSPVLRARTQPG